MNYIVMDLEFNQPFPFRTGIKTELEPECPFEIIEIGAVKLDEKFQKIADFRIMIKPQIYPRIHPYVEKITKIHWCDVKNAPAFPEAYHEFLNFIGTEKSVLSTWGVDDIKSLFKNILFYEQDIMGITDQYINIQPMAAHYLNHENGKSIGLKTAVEALDLTIESPFHDALYDAQYTAKVFSIVKTDTMTPDVFHVLDLAKSKVPSARLHITALVVHFEETMGRALTPEEKILVKKAYKLGHDRSYDILPKKKLQTEKGK